MSSEQQYDRIFQALSDSRRRAILDLLKEQPRTTGDLCEQFPSLDRCTVMQHLGVLERADLIIVKREGRFRWNHLNVLPFKEIHDRWIDPFSTAAIEFLARIKRDLEYPKPRSIRKNRSK